MGAVRIVIRGHVQGVGFRAFVRETALNLGVSGEVWNREDGAVETVGQHSDGQILERFIDEIRSGPGRVTSLETSPSVQEPGRGFEIRPTRPA